MSLIAELSRVRTEEDVKDAYIKALGLKKYNKGLIDIQTEEIWFEAKEAATPPVLMFTQLLFYVRDARKKGEHVPPFLAVIDREKAAIMETVKALEDMGAEVIGAACIADRRAEDCDFALPVYAALKLAIDSYEPDDCPICREGNLKLEKPGSRELPVAK